MTDWLGLIPIRFSTPGTAGIRFTNEFYNAHFAENVSENRRSEPERKRYFTGETKRKLGNFRNGTKQKLQLDSFNSSNCQNAKIFSKYLDSSQRRTDTRTTRSDNKVSGLRFENREKGVQRK